MPKGTVKFFDSKKGWGYITPDDGSREAYVHFSDILGAGFRTLETDDRVEFTLTHNDRGPRATGVIVILPAASNPAAPAPRREPRPARHGVSPRFLERDGEPRLKRFHD